MIKIEVFEISSRQQKLLDQQWENGENEHYELFECNLIERNFFTIDNFAEHIDETTKTKCTSFYSGGMEWITPLHIEDFLKLLQGK